MDQSSDASDRPGLPRQPAERRLVRRGVTDTGSASPPTSHSESLPAGSRNGRISSMRKTRSARAGISAWPEEERPRERLLRRGPQALTDAELVAILLRTGVRGASALDLARQVLVRFGSLRGMAEAPILALLAVNGLKEAKAAQLAAALEISRRVFAGPGSPKPRILSTEQAGNYVMRRLGSLPDEHFRVLYLNRRNTLLRDALIARGDPDAVHASLRRIVVQALECSATALIAAHNHPSGNPDPSESDRLLTKDLIAATRPIGVRVLDHVVVAGDSHYSFAESGALDELELECLAPGTADSSSRLRRRPQ